MLGFLSMSTFAISNPIKTEFTKEVNAKTSLAMAIENAMPFVVVMKNVENNIFISCELDALSYCVTNESTIKFTLENGQSVTLQNINGIDCGTRSKYVMLINSDNLNKLKQSPVAKIQMFTDSGNIELNRIIDKSFFIRELT